MATAGAGLYDELDRPNAVLREILGVEPVGLDQPEESRVIWIKQDLPTAEVIDHATMTADRLAFVASRWPDTAYRMPIVGVRSRFTAEASGDVVYTFSDGAPAVVARPVEKGWAAYCAMLPGLSYYHPAIPMRPVDRGATEQAMIHLLPTRFDPAAAALIAAPAISLARPVRCSVPMVETTVIQSRRGAVIPLVNWTPDPISNLQVQVNIRVPVGRPSLASGQPLQAEKRDGSMVYTLDLDAADALILR
jgi:hypothetical protein